LLLHIRQSNEQLATHNYRLTKLESSPQQRTIKPDTGELTKRRELPRAIRDVFNEAEFRLFVYGLGGDVEDLEGDTFSEVVLSAVMWMQRQGRFGELLGALGRERPLVGWDRFR
jgi:hypothetical protein